MCDKFNLNKIAEEALEDSLPFKSRKIYEKDMKLYPSGFVDKPTIKPDGSLNMLRWECVILEKMGTVQEEGSYKILLKIFNRPNNNFLL